MIVGRPSRVERVAGLRPTAMGCSTRRRSGGSPAMRGSAGSSLTGRVSRSTWGGARVLCRRRSAGLSSFVTAAARRPGATDRLGGAMRTTSSTGPTAVRRASTTSACCAADTTARRTRDGCWVEPGRPDAAGRCGSGHRHVAARQRQRAQLPFRWAQPLGWQSYRPPFVAGRRSHCRRLLRARLPEECWCRLGVR